MLRVVLLSLMLLGCSKPIHIPTGQDVQPPKGAVQFCKDNPGDALCQNR
jgi:hypothetical protein